MSALQEVEDAIETIYLEAYAAYANKKIRDLPRLDPTVGPLGVLWEQFDRIVSTRGD